MKRFFVLLYGIVAYAVFFLTFLYAIGFVGGLWVPKGIDDGASRSVGMAIAIDLALLGLFAAQHNVMARPRFKEWWTRFVPRPIERSTYVLAASGVLILLFWQWRPLPSVVWAVSSPLAGSLLWALFGLGWVIVLASTFLIDHFELFGLKQVLSYARGREMRAPEFQVSGLYRFVRHPLMLGFVIAFWATPEMTVGHLLFAATTTVWILITLVFFEERDLLRQHGEDYERYRQRVSMLLPLPRRGG